MGPMEISVKIKEKLLDYLEAANATVQELDIPALSAKQHWNVQQIK